MSDIESIRDGLVHVIKNGTDPTLIRRVWPLDSPQELALLLTDDRIARVRVVDIKEA